MASAPVKASERWEYRPSRAMGGCSFKVGEREMPHNPGVPYPVYCNVPRKWRRVRRAGQPWRPASRLEEQQYPPYLCTAHRKVVVERRDYNK